MKTKEQIKGSIILLITAFIWGTAFVAQRKGMDYLGPFTFNGFRSIFSSIALGIYIIINSLINKKKTVVTLDKKTNIKNTIIGGVVIGVALFVATSLQQIGLVTVNAGKAGFISSLYIVFVALLGLFIKKKVSIIGWISVTIAMIGSYLLCIDSNFIIGKGEILIVISAIFFALQILLIDYFNKKCQAIQLSCIQFLIVFILSIIPMFFEDINLNNFIRALPSLLYAGVFSGAVAYTLQIIGQKKVSPLIASLIMGLEAVFAVITSAIILQERLLPVEIIGCLLVFLAVMLVQLPIKIFKMKGKNQDERKENV